MQPTADFHHHLAHTRFPQSARPNNGSATRGEAALPSFIGALFSRIESLSRKLDAFTRFSAPLLLRPHLCLPYISYCSLLEPLHQLNESSCRAQTG